MKDKLYFFEVWDHNKTFQFREKILKCHGHGTTLSLTGYFFVSNKKYVNLFQTFLEDDEVPTFGGFLQLLWNMSAQVPPLVNTTGAVGEPKSRLKCPTLPMGLVLVPVFVRN